MKAVTAVVAMAALSAAGTLATQDADRKVAGGGITVKGWKGMIDAGAAKKGATINDSKFMEMGGGFHLTIGPAATYWNPANTASGDYTVGATFAEGKSSANHPHSYGIFIGGSKLDTPEQSYVYCVAYGNGTFLVRGFTGDKVVDYAKRQPHDAVKKAGEDGRVTQEIAWTVKGNRAECAINGAVVAGFDKSELVGPGKLESTDGIYGIRVSHNVDVMVTNFGKR
ncbi:MAG TPA: hypothetical protein VM364_04235 [Vicinamibacterales bacterium]|nr:hypothetical protein [Vicinamibacterales bacterium]